jgi:DNA-binding SARP family transcriptional activator
LAGTLTHVVSSLSVLQTVLSGGVQVFEAGTALKLSKQTQRVIVGLASSRGIAVHADTLVDRLWDEPPADYQVATRVAIKRARQQLNDAPLLETVQLGYRYECDPATVDLWRFEFEAERLLDDSTVATLEEIEACLAIWQGEPFGTFGSLPYLLPLATHYTELHRTLQELWLRQLVNGDDSSRAVRVGETLVAEEPLRENRWASLMIALYRNDRQTDALRAYQRARDVLAEASGLEPGSVLVDLERRILDHDPALLSGLIVAGKPADGQTTLIGRDQQIRLLTESNSAALHVPVCVVGEPGIGKTSLLRAVGAVLETQAKNIIWVRSILSADATERPSRPAETLASLLTQVLAVPGITAPTTSEAIALASVVPLHHFEGFDLGTEQLDRAEVIGRITTYLKATVETQDLAIFLDDCQWLDRVSAEVLQGLVSTKRPTTFDEPGTKDSNTGAGEPGSASTAVTAVFFAANPCTQPHLQWLYDGAAVKSLELPPLQLDEVRLFLEHRRVASAVAQRAEEFWERSGGNPLLLDLLVDAAATNKSSDLSASTRAVVLRRLEALSQRAITTLEYASVFGKTFSLDSLSSVRPGAMGDLLEASDARLVTVVRSESGDRHFARDEKLAPDATCAFHHGLVAEIVYDQIPEGRKVELHDQVGELLVAQNVPAVAYARHFLAAATLDPLRAVQASFLAAQENESAYAFEEALAFCDRGLVALSQSNRSAPELQAQLTVKSGRLMRLCQLPQSRLQLLAGAELARSAGLPELFGEAAIELCSHGETSTVGSVDPEAAAVLDEALSLNQPVELRARLCSAAATLLFASKAGSRGRALFLQAVDLAEGLNDDSVEAAVLMNAYLGLSDPDDFERLQHAERRLHKLAYRQGNQHPSYLNLWESAFLRVGNSIALADRNSLDHAMVSLRELTPLVKDRPRDFGLAFSEAAYTHAIGDATKASEWAEKALAVGLVSFNPSWAFTMYSVVKLSLEIDRGTIGELGPTVDRLIVDMPDIESWRSVASLIALELGDLSRAQQELHRSLRDSGSHVVRDQSWAPTVMCLGRTAHGLGDAASAKQLYGMIVPYAGRMSWMGGATYGPFDLVLSKLASTLGDAALTAQHRERCNELATRLGCKQYVL